MTEAIDLEVLIQPISTSSPSGEYLYSDPLYRQLDQALRHGPEWQVVATLGIETLARRSKDLQIAARVTQALGRLHGLDGLRQGFQLLTALQDTFWPTIHPLPDNDDIDPRLAPYDSIEFDIPPILDVGILLTAAPLSTNFNRQRFEHPSMTSAELDARDETIRRTDESFFRKLAADLDACRSAYDHWRESVRRHLGPHSPNFSQLTKMFDGIASCIRTIEKVRPFRNPEPPPQPSAEASRTFPTPSAAVDLNSPPAVNVDHPPAPAAGAGVAKSSSRAVAEEAAWLASSGRFEAAVELLDTARQTARCRRDRFIRQLELVEICLTVREIRLAKTLSEELLGELTFRKLEEWEDPSLCARVIAASLSCHKATNADLDQEPFFSLRERLGRLDPRRALDLAGR